MKWICCAYTPIDDLTIAVKALEKRVKALEGGAPLVPTSVYMKVALDGVTGYIYRDENGTDPFLHSHGGNVSVKYTNDQLPETFTGDDGNVYYVKAQINKGVIFLPRNETSS